MVRSKSWFVVDEGARALSNGPPPNGPPRVTPVEAPHPALRSRLLSRLDASGLALCLPDRLRGALLCSLAAVSLFVASACCRLGADPTADAGAPTPTDASADAPVDAALPGIPIQPTSDPGANTGANGGQPERQIAGAAHILIAYKGAEIAPKEVTRSKEEAKKRAEEVLAKLHAESGTFADLAKVYSDDPSKIAGGAIGNFERNAMPAAFSDATFALEIGAMSGVVESPRGFHIIKRTR